MEAVLWGATSLSSVWWFFSVLTKTRRQHEHIKKLEDTEIQNPSRLLKNLSNERFLSKWTQDPDFPNEFKKPYFIQGNVSCDYPIQCSLDPSVKAVYLIRFKDELYSGDVLRKRVYEIEHDSKAVSMPLYFSLDDSVGGYKCRVGRSLQVECGDDILERLTEKTTRFPLSAIEQIIIFLTTALNYILATLRSDGSYFRGYQIGFTEKEVGIRVGSVLTTYGEIIYDRVQKTLRIEQPLYFFSSKSLLIKKLNHSLAWKNVSLFLASLLFAGSTFMLVRAVKKEFRKWSESRTRKATDPLGQIKKLTIDDYQCRVCQKNPRNVITRPCLHFVLCHACAAKAETTSCPQCNTTINKNIEVFFV